MFQRLMLLDYQIRLDLASGMVSVDVEKEAMSCFIRHDMLIFTKKSTWFLLKTIDIVLCKCPTIAREV